MSSTELLDAASISMTSSDVAAAIAVHDSHLPHGSTVGPCSQFRQAARIFAIDVLPVPASPRRDRRGGPCPAPRHCAACARRAPVRRRPRSCAGGGGGTARGRQARDDRVYAAPRRGSADRAIRVAARGMARTAGAVALLAALAWALAGRSLVNYDTLYALVWGRDLAGGAGVDLDVPVAPTPHPLATLAGAVLAPLSETSDRGVHGEAAVAVTEAGAFVALGALGLVVFRLGAAWFNPAAGALAAAIVLTRRPVLDFGARIRGRPVPSAGARRAAGRDAPAARRRARAGAAGGRRAAAPRGLAVLRRLRRVAVVGRARRDVRLIALAASAPLLWAGRPRRRRRPAVLADRHPRGRARARPDHRSGRRAAHGPRRLGEILRSRSSAPRAAGCSRSRTCARARCRARWRGRWRSRPSACWRQPACRSSAATCCSRRRCWRSSAAPGRSAGRCCRGDKRRRAWAWFGALTLVLLVAFAAQARRIDALRAALARRTPSSATSPRSSAAPRSDPTVVPAGDRPQPPPRPVAGAGSTCRPARSSAPSAARRSGAFVTPASARVATDYVLDPRDADRRIAPVPPGFEPVAANASWRVAARC